MPDNSLAPPNMPWLWQPNSPVGQPNSLGPPMLNYAAPPDATTSQGADVLAGKAQQAWQWLQDQRAESVRQGLLDPDTGLPTQKGAVEGLRATAEGVMMGTTAPGGKELPMDVASRLQRAGDMGFDTSKTMYHATPYNFSEFVPSSWRGATYLAPTPEGAMRGAGAGGMEHPTLSGPTGSGEKTGMNIIPAYTAGKIWGRDPLPSGWLPETLNYGQYKAIVNGSDRIAPEGFSKQQIDAINAERIDAARRHYTEAVPESEYHKYAGDNEDQLPMKLETAPVAQPFGYESIEGSDQPNAFAPSGSMAPAERREMLQKLGYSGWMVRDEAGNSIAIADPSKIRSTFADFDPSKAKSRNISAGVAGLIAGGGAGAAATQQQQPSQ